jgi:hypothetical protein
MEVLDHVFLVWWNNQNFCCVKERKWWKISKLKDVEKLSAPCEYFVALFLS